MVVLTALRSALAGLARNPVLFVATGVVTLLQLPYFAAQWLGPLAATVLSLLLTVVSVLVVPFFQAGLLGMADEAIDGRTRLGTFVGAGRVHYVPMLIAYLLLFAVLFVFWIAVLFGGFLYAAFVFGPGGSPLGNPISLAVGVVLAVAILLLYLGFVFFVQFYGQAIVVDGLGAIDGYRRSVRLVRRNLVPTLGYFVLAGFLGLLVGGVASVASILVAPRTAEWLTVPTLPPGVTVAVVVLALALTVLASAFFAIFSVAFYREIASRGAAPAPAASGD